MLAAKAIASLRICTDSSESLLFDNNKYNCVAYKESLILDNKREIYP